MNSGCRLGLVSLAAGLLLLCAEPGHAQDQDSSQAAPDTIAPAVDLVVLPFANYTGHTDAVGVVMSRIYRHLQNSDLSFLTDMEIRPLLRNHRIRSVGRIGRQGADIIRTQTGASFLLIGSLDIYRLESNPELGVSVRLIDLSSLTVVKAASAAATSEDHAGLFGIGKPGTGNELANRVLDELFARLGDPLLTVPSASGNQEPCRQVALVPFDNRSELAYAGDIFSNILLSELASKGYLVVEPGFVNEVFLQRQVVSRGQIDLETLKAMYEHLQPCFVVTGVVDIFKPALGDISEAAPVLEMGARVLDAGAGKLVLTYNEEKSGHDSESLFRMGRTYSLGRLAQAAARQLVSQIEHRHKKLYPEVN